MKNKERVKHIKDALLTFVKNNKEKGGEIIYIPLVIQGLLIVYTMIRHKAFGISGLLLMGAMLVLTILLARVFIPGIENFEKAKEKAFNAIPMSFFALIFYFTAIPIICSPKRKIGIVFMIFVLDILIVLILLTNERFKKFRKETIEAADISELFGEKDLSPGDVVLCKNKDALEGGSADPRAIIRLKDRFLHMLILGATGTGKTSQILLPMITQDVQNPEVGVIIFDPKGDLAMQSRFIAEHYGREAKLFDPAMDDCPHFNPMAGREMDVVENIAMTFRMLMPDSATFFLDLSEQLVRYSVKCLKRLDKSEGIEGKYANLITLSRLLQNTGGDGRTLISKLQHVTAPNEEEDSENREICSWFLNDYFPEKSKVYENTSGVRSQVARICSNEFLRSVLNPDVEKGEKNDIDFDKALRDGEVLCISTSQGVLRGLSSFLGYFLILQLQSAVFRRQGDENTRRPCFLYIDEFQTYSTPGFADMLTMGRSYRVASHLATQARSQMEMGAGRAGRDFVNLVSTNARNVVLFPGASKDDAEYYSKQFGEYEDVEVSVTHMKKGFNPFTGGWTMPGHPSEGIREQNKMKANFSPTDIIYRPFGEIVYSIIKDNTLQPAAVGIASYIDKDLKEEIDDKMLTYQREHKKSSTEDGVKSQRKENEDKITWDDEEEELPELTGAEVVFDEEEETSPEDDDMFDMFR